jgi:DNA-directed RNA polymerase subunit H (RpoH/RPB5)
MMVALLMFHGTIVKIVRSKKLVQMIVCYFVVDTLALAKW